MRVFWSKCAGNKNFGDRLTVFLLKKAGIKVEWAPPHKAQLFGAGSIVEKIPSSSRATVLGSGLMFEQSAKRLPRANVLGLRGPLTAQRCKQEDIPLFDLGMLCRDYAPEKRGVLTGCIPHYADDSLAGRVCADVTIDVTQRVQQIIDQASRCSIIHTSSLHGAILADSLGIERVVHPSPHVLGDGFKFRDWDAAVERHGTLNLYLNAKQGLKEVLDGHQ